MRKTDRKTTFAMILLTVAVYVIIFLTLFLAYRRYLDSIWIPPYGADIAFLETMYGMLAIAIGGGLVGFWCFIAGMKIKKH